MTHVRCGMVLNITVESRVTSLNYTAILQRITAIQIYLYIEFSDFSLRNYQSFYLNSALLYNLLSSKWQTSNCHSLYICNSKVRVTNYNWISKPFIHIFNFFLKNSNPDFTYNKKDHALRTLKSGPSSQN